MIRSLVSARRAREIDNEAIGEWALSEASLVEAAGRLCAGVLSRELGFAQRPPRVVVFAGRGNNGQDALTMMRALICAKWAEAASCAVVVKEGSQRPIALSRMGVEVTSSLRRAASLAENAGILVDGICGTGLSRPLSGFYAENWLPLLSRGSGRVVASVDVPSGLYDGWKTGDPIVHADITLAIEPLKAALYRPSPRVFAGKILPVTGVFPPQILENQTRDENTITSAENSDGNISNSVLVDWDYCKNLAPPLPKNAYKYTRGVVEVHAGSEGALGAAIIASRGAQAGGAGLVRLLVDKDLYPVVSAGLCASFPGIMSGIQAHDSSDNGRFSPNVILAGPGWGKNEERKTELERFFAREAAGTPLVLDADAIFLAKGHVFAGNAVLTPHPGEAAALLDVEKEALSEDPLPILKEAAARLNAVLLFKSHILCVLAPDGRAAVIDGLLPVLGGGGSGDLLAGLVCAPLARGVPPFEAALIAASLLAETARKSKKAFYDPIELASEASKLAGRAYL